MKTLTLAGLAVGILLGTPAYAQNAGTDPGARRATTTAPRTLVEPIFEGRSAAELNNNELIRKFYLGL